jgi:hypothetical protein
MTRNTILFQKDGSQASIHFGECKLLEHVQVTDAIDRFLCEEGMSNILTDEHSAQTSTLGLSIICLIFWCGVPCQNSQLWMCCYMQYIVSSENVMVSQNHECLWHLLQMIRVTFKSLTQSYVKLPFVYFADVLPERLSKSSSLLVIGLSCLWDWKVNWNYDLRNLFHGLIHMSDPLECRHDGSFLCKVWLCSVVYKSYCALCCGALCLYSFILLFWTRSEMSDFTKCESNTELLIKTACIRILRSSVKKL